VVAAITPLSVGPNWAAVKIAVPKKAHLTGRTTQRMSIKWPLD